MPVADSTDSAGSAARKGPGPTRAGTLAAASLGIGVVQLDVFVVNVGVRQIGAALGGGTSGLQWVVSVYTLMFAALILTGGALGDRFGARRMFTGGFVVFVVASLGCGLAPGLGALIAARAVQGAGAAVLAGCSLALISHVFADQAGRARAVAIWAAGAAAALSAGPVIGGVLIAALGWRSIFFINLPIGAAGVLLTRMYAPETQPSGRRIDLPGQVAAIVALGALTWALIQGGAAGFASPAILAGFAVAVTAGAAFCLAQARSSEPMLPLALFRRPPFAAPAILGLLVNVAFYGLIFCISLLFQQQDGYSPLRAGLAFLPMSAAVLAANLSAGRLGPAIGTRRVIWTGLAGMAAGCAGLLAAGPGTPFTQMVAQLVVLGAGIGLLVPPMTSELMGSVDRSRSGMASGTLNAMRQAGSVLGVAVFGSLIAAKDRFAPGLHIALLISIALIAAGAALTTIIGRTAIGDAIGVCGRRVRRTGTLDDGRRTGTVHALRVHDQQDKDIRYEQAPDPSPGTGDVLVEVRAATFTPTELDWPSTWVDRSGRDRTPVIPGHEVSGIVTACGYGTTGLAPGDEVYGITDWYRDGAAADYVAAEARNLAHKPASVTHPEAAALSLAGLTAWQALFVHGDLKPGQTVVITGASGGVGTLAVQLARDSDARVAAVAHGWARDLLDGLDATEFIDAGDPHAGVTDADLLLDLTGGDLADRYAAMIRRGGTVVSVVASQPPVPADGKSVFFVVEPDRAQLTELARLADAGRIRPVIGKQVRMADAPAEAFAAKRAGGVPGKVILQTG